MSIPTVYQEGMRRIEYVTYGDCNNWEITLE
jgi:hypothetical protein